MYRMEIGALVVDLSFGTRCWWAEEAENPPTCTPRGFALTRFVFFGALSLSLSNSNSWFFVLFVTVVCSSYLSLVSFLLALDVSLTLSGFLLHHLMVR